MERNLPPLEFADTRKVVKCIWEIVQSKRCSAASRAVGRVVREDL